MVGAGSGFRVLFSASKFEPHFCSVGTSVGNEGVRDDFVYCMFVIFIWTITMISILQQKPNVVFFVIAALGFNEAFDEI